MSDYREYHEPSNFEYIWLELKEFVQLVPASENVKAKQ